MNMINKSDKNSVCSSLLNNNIVILPTDTVYGIAANALETIAVKKIFQIKKRPYNKPLIVNYYSLQDVEVDAIVCPLAKKLIEIYWPGSLTLVLKKRTRCKISNMVFANKNSIAVRVPSHPFVRSVLKTVQFPLAISSANISGDVTLNNAIQIKKSLTEEFKQIQFIESSIDFHGVESTIIDLHTGKVKLLRKGILSTENLEKIIPELELPPNA